MRRLLCLLPIALLALCPCGCGSKSPADSDLPPGVRKNENRPAPGTIKSSKPVIIDMKPKKRG